MDADSCHLLPRDTPIRVLFEMPTKSLESDDKFQSVRETINAVLPIIFRPCAVDDSPPPHTRLLVIELRDKRSFAILDANHSAYDFLTAHEKRNNQLPVYEVGLAYPDRPLVRRVVGFDKMINKIVAGLHRLNGFEVRLPFCRDRAAGVMCYRNPRDLHVVVPKEAEKEA